MARVHGIHEIVLKPGVSGEEFERFFTKEVLPAFHLPGLRFHLWKGDRGERSGQYAVVIEIESVETRDRLFPAQDTMSKEAQQFADAQQGALERWASLASVPDDGTTVYTDYVTVGG